MSAVARELIYALESHPSVTPPRGAQILVAIDGDDETRDGTEKYKDIRTLSAHLTEILTDDEWGYRVDVATAEAFLSNAKSRTTGYNKNVEPERLPKELYEAAILSNVLTGTKAVDDKAQLSVVLTTLLVAVREGGVVVIRENIANRSARMIADITQFLDVFVTTVTDADGHRLLVGFNFYSMNQIQASLFGGAANHLDVCWTLEKRVEHDDMDRPADAQLRTFREFLDRTQYTLDNVQSYEWIFGENFISPGGLAENRRVLKRFTHLRPGHRMLDIGVGIGGGARQAANEFGLRVLGCDLSSNMIVHAFERNHRDKDARVEYQIADATRYRHPADSFDVVFSRDCIQHIRHTDVLFTNIYKWLKPGGQMLITMYGKGSGQLAPKFLDYVADRRYFLRTLDEFVQYAKGAGFVNVHAENMTARLAEILHAEREKALRNRDDFEKKFDPQLFDKMMTSWSDKLKFIADDNHKWLLIRGDKPSLAEQ